MSTETQNAQPEEETEGVPMVVTSGPDGKMIRRPATEAELEHRAKAQERAAQRESKTVEEANEVLSLLDPSDKIHVVTREIEFGGKVLTFRIKELSFSECAALEAKKYRRQSNGQIIRDVQHEETNSIAWLLHWCLMKDKNAGNLNEAGEPLEPEWVSLFTLNQVKERFINNGDKKAMNLLYQLTACCWEVNPQANPIAQAAALQETMG